MFCDSNQHQCGAHLVTNKNRIGSKNDIYSKCYIGSTQDIANGFALCEICHDLFEDYYVGVNPDTMQVEVSKVLLKSKDKKVRDKWTSIHAKVIGPKSKMGHWPTVEAFRVKYNAFLKKSIK